MLLRAMISCYTISRPLIRNLSSSYKQLDSPRSTLLRHTTAFSTHVSYNGFHGPLPLHPAEQRSYSSRTKHASPAWYESAESTRTGGVGIRSLPSAEGGGVRGCRSAAEIGRRGGTLRGLACSGGRRRFLWKFWGGKVLISLVVEVGK